MWDLRMPNLQEDITKTSITIVGAMLKRVNGLRDSHMKILNSATMDTLNDLHNKNDLFH